MRHSYKEAKGGDDERQGAGLRNQSLSGMRDMFPWPAMAQPDSVRRQSLTFPHPDSSPISSWHPWRLREFDLFPIRRQVPRSSLHTSNLLRHSLQFAPGMISGLTKIARTEGAASLYAGFLPLICKQIPYAIGQVRPLLTLRSSLKLTSRSCKQFTVNEFCHELAFKGMTPEQQAQLSEVKKLSITLGSGIVAGFAAAILSHVCCGSLCSKSQQADLISNVLRCSRRIHFFRKLTKVTARRDPWSPD